MWWTSSHIILVIDEVPHTDPPNPNSETTELVTAERTRNDSWFSTPELDMLNHLVTGHDLYLKTWISVSVKRPDYVHPLRGCTLKKEKERERGPHTSASFFQSHDSDAIHSFQRKNKWGRLSVLGQCRLCKGSPCTWKNNQEGFSLTACCFATLWAHILPSTASFVFL